MVDNTNSNCKKEDGVTNGDPVRNKQVIKIIKYDWFKYPVTRTYNSQMIQYGRHVNDQALKKLDFTDDLKSNGHITTNDTATAVTDPLIPMNCSLAQEIQIISIFIFYYRSWWCC